MWKHYAINTGDIATVCNTSNCQLPSQNCRCRHVQAKRNTKHYSATAPISLRRFDVKYTRRIERLVNTAVGEFIKRTEYKYVCVSMYTDDDINKKWNAELNEALVDESNLHYGQL